MTDVLAQTQLIV